MENGLTHFDAGGKAAMVDVTEKEATKRTAVATGSIHTNPEVFEAIQKGSVEKGDVLGIARVAGIMAAKRTSELIPLCHPLKIGPICFSSSWNTHDISQRMVPLAEVWR